jgi:hypothetical protein
MMYADIFVEFWVSAGLSEAKTRRGRLTRQSDVERCRETNAYFGRSETGKPGGQRIGGDGNSLKGVPALQPITPIQAACWIHASFPLGRRLKAQLRCWAERDFRVCSTSSLAWRMAD